MGGWGALKETELCPFHPLFPVVQEGRQGARRCVYLGRNFIREFSCQQTFEKC